MKKLFISLILCLSLFSLSACSEKTESLSQDFFAMDTYMSISLDGTDVQTVITECQTAVFGLEALISRTIETSDVYKLNHAEGEVVTVSDVTYEILEISLECSEKTAGAFDITICPITDLWAIGTTDAHVPSSEEIENALESVSYKNIVLLGDNQVQLLNGAQIDLGAVGKGYAADMLIEILEENDITRGVISLAGNIYVYGEKADGSLWNIGIADPDDSSEINITVQTSFNSIVTTGAYERYFEEDAVIYHHIFDTSTGYPTTADIKSVTVISKSSSLADIYATALFAMGYDEAVAFAETEDTIDVVIIRDDDTVFVSEGLSVEMADKYVLAE